MRPRKIISSTLPETRTSNLCSYNAKIASSKRKICDTSTRGISSEAFKDSSWVIEPSVLRTTDWPFKPNQEVINKVRLKDPLSEIDICVETSFTFVTDVASIKHPDQGFD